MMWSCEVQVIIKHTHAQTHCFFELLHIQYHPATLNRGKGTMPELRTVELTLSIGISPPLIFGIIIIMLLAYHQYSLFSFSRHSLLYYHVCLTWPHHHLSAKLYTSVPVSVNYSLKKATIGCQSVWLSASVSMNCCSFVPTSKQIASSTLTHAWTQKHKQTAIADTYKSTDSLQGHTCTVVGT